MLEHALSYFDKGYSIIPLDNVKRPRIQSWKQYQSERATREAVEKWWAMWPDASIGVITGSVSGGLIVVDVDKSDNQWPNDPDKLYDLSTGLVSRTGGGGKHYWFKTKSKIGNSVSKLAHNVDTRCEGGYIVAPPSKHQSGGSYEFIDCELCSADDLPEPPHWLMVEINRIDRKESKASCDTDWAKMLSTGVDDGQRNDLSVKLAGYLLGRGLSFDETHQILSDWNVKNRPPLEARALERNIQGIYDRELLKRQDSDKLQSIRETVSAADEGKSGEGRERGLEALSEKFCIDLTNVRRICGDEPYYELTVSGAVATVPASLMTTATAFRKAVTLAAEVIPEELGKKEKWSHWGNLIMAVAERVDAGSDATLKGMLTLYMGEFIKRRGIHPAHSAPGTREPIFYKGHVYINHRAVLRYIKGHSDVDLSERQYAQLLKRYGHSQKQIRLTLDTGERERLRLYMVDFPDAPEELADACAEAIEASELSSVTLSQVGQEGSEAKLSSSIYIDNEFCGTVTLPKNPPATKLEQKSAGLFSGKECDNEVHEDANSLVAQGLTAAKAVTLPPNDECDTEGAE